MFEKINQFRNHRKKNHVRLSNIVTVQRSNKAVEALHLPKILNLNPRSAMNKIEELQTFIEEQNIDCAFISESHETENKRLEDQIKLEDYVVISNVNQRLGKGGRPALIVNKQKYDVQNITNSIINLPWGVEITWALLTPKHVSNASIIQHIVLGAIYSKPNSKFKTEMLDHIQSTYNFLNTKYGKGLYWMLAGDTNDLKLGPIIHLSPNMKSMVDKPTRLNPDKILDNIITDMGKWYQTPECLAPLEADIGSGGKPSDHLPVIMSPIDMINNKPARAERIVKVRPMKQTGIDLFGHWLKNQDWNEMYNADTVDEKVEIFHNSLLEKVDEFLPEKTRKISNDDQPFCTEEMKRLKRLKSREYKKNRKSLKWRDLNVKYQKEVSKAKRNYYRNIIRDLKESKVAQWYSKLKRLCSYDQMKSEPIIVESIKHLTDKEQAEIIADKFAKVSQEYEPLKSEDIHVPEFEQSTIPSFTHQQVKKHLEKIKTNKAVPPGDIPPKLIKTFAAEMSKPLSHIINSSIKMGKWSKLYKLESVTPVPKVFPPKTVEDLRNISGLKTFDKIAEKLIAELIISDMSKKLDPAQFANQKGLSLQHYLIKMIHKILNDLDNNSKGEVTAVLATLIDWKEAFPRQCPKLGIEAFIKCGVRGALIPLLINYLQDRTMEVKWHGQTSTIRKLNGGGPQGATFGIWEYLAQTNDNADCVSIDQRYKFVDDLTILEKINLLVVGMTSFNSKATVPNDIPDHNQYIPGENLASQKYLNQIKDWTEKQKMILNQKKTKSMVFNFTDLYQFGTRLELNNEHIEVVKMAKLLGVIITDDLKWDQNTTSLVKTANQRMELLRKVASFGTNKEEKKNIYILYVRSILEQSCVVWHSSLTKENEEDLERIQKSAVRIINGADYDNYEDALIKSNLEPLKTRRKDLCLRFAQKCLKNDKTKQMFPKSSKNHDMLIRKSEKYEVEHANTARFQNSSIPYMQNLLNKHEEELNRRHRKLG